MTKVERLHSEGKKYYSYPYRLYVLDNTDGDADETVISVPKKIFKRAVKRNLVRRRTREALRHIKKECPEEALRHIKKECPDFAGKDILMVYTANEILEYGKIAECLSNALAKVAKDA